MSSLLIIQIRNGPCWEIDEPDVHSRHAPLGQELTEIVHQEPLMELVTLDSVQEHLLPGKFQVQLILLRLQLLFVVQLLLPTLLPQFILQLHLRVKLPLIRLPL